MCYPARKWNKSWNGWQRGADNVQMVRRSYEVGVYCLFARTDLAHGDAYVKTTTHRADSVSRLRQITQRDGIHVFQLRRCFLRHHNGGSLWIICGKQQHVGIRGRGIFRKMMDAEGFKQTRQAL